MEGRVIDKWYVDNPDEKHHRLCIERIDGCNDLQVTNEWLFKLVGSNKPGKWKQGKNFIAPIIGFDFD